MSDFRLSSYFPSSTFSDSGKWFYDNILGSLFSDYPDENKIQSFLVDDISQASSSLTIDASISNKIFPGDIVYISNQFASKTRTTFQAIPKGGNNTTTTINIVDSVPFKIERKIIKSFQNNIINLTTPLDNNYRQGHTVIIRTRNEKKNRVLLEVSQGNKLSLSGSKLDSKYLLTSYTKDNIVYNIPLDSSPFDIVPDPNSIEVRYIDSRHSAWVDLISGVDFTINQTNSLELQITNDSTKINHPVNLSLPVVFKAIEIAYRPLFVSLLDLKNDELIKYLPQGKYFREGNINFDSNNKYISGIPTVSDTFMTTAEQMVEGFNPLEEEDLNSLNAYAEMLGVHNEFDRIPSRLGKIVVDSTDIFGSIGTKKLTQQIAMMLGIQAAEIDNVYALSISPAMKLYETFYKNQGNIPSYKFIEILFGYRDNSVSGTQIGTVGIGNSGFYTTESIDSTTQESFTVIIGNSQLSRIGLIDSSLTTDYDQTKIDYAIELRQNNELWVYQGNTLISSVSEGTYKVGDKITFLSTIGGIDLYLNNTKLTTSFSLVTGNYRFVAILSSTNASIVNTTKHFSNGDNATTTFLVNQNIEKGFSILGQKLLPYLYRFFFGSPPSSNETSYSLAPFSLSEYGNPKPGIASIWTEDDIKRAYAFFVLPQSHNIVLDSLSFDTSNWETKNVIINNSSSISFINSLYPTKKIIMVPSFDAHLLNQNMLTVATEVYGTNNYGSGQFSSKAGNPGLTLQAGNYFVSIYARYNGESLGSISIISTTNEAATVIYDVLEGTIINHAGSLYKNSGVEEKHSGWFRIWMEIELITTLNLGIQYVIGPGNIGDNVSGLHLWGAAITQYDLEEFSDKNNIFNSVIDSSINNILENQSSYKDNDIMSLSSFAVTTDVLQPSLLDNPTSFLTTQIENVKPFSRTVYEINEHQKDQFNKIIPSITFPYPLLYMSMQASAAIEIGVNHNFLFSRASNGSYRSQTNQLLFAGVDEIRHEDHGKGNLLAYSDTFTNTTGWDALGIVLDSNIEISPDGFKRAVKFRSDTSFGMHYIRQTNISLTSGLSYTASLYIRTTNNSPFISLFIWDEGNESGGITIDPNTNTIIRSDGGGNNLGKNIYNTSRVTNIGNDWYRYELVVDPQTSTSFNYYIMLTDGTTANVPPAYLGNSIQDVQIFGAQLEEGVTASSYISTLISSPKGKNYLLMEDDGINLITDSEDFTSATWTSNVTGILTLGNGTQIDFYDPTIDPALGVFNSGTITSTEQSPALDLAANKFTANAFNTQHYLRYVVDIGSGLSSIPTIYRTFSIFVKANTQNYGRLEINNGTVITGLYFDLSSGKILSTYGTHYLNSKIKSFINNWYRIEIAASIDTSAEIGVSLFMDNAANDSSDWIGNNTTTAFNVYGAQFEAGIGATSYIRSLGTQGTRTEDVLTLLPDGNLIASNKSYTFMADIILNSNSITILQNLFNIQGEASRYLSLQNNVPQMINGVNASSGGAVINNQKSSILFRFDSITRQMDLYLNKNLVSSGIGDFAVGNPSAIEIGRKLNGLIGNIRIYSSKLTDSEILFLL